MADGNIADKDVDFCRGCAAADDDVRGAEFAGILRRMSKTQRLKLRSTLANRANRLPK